MPHFGIPHTFDDIQTGFFSPGPDPGHVPGPRCLSTFGSFIPHGSVIQQGSSIPKYSLVLIAPRSLLGQDVLLTRRILPGRRSETARAWAGLG